MQRAEILAIACDLVAQDRITEAKESLLNTYPGAVASSSRGAWPLKRLVKVFIRDGFTDRYFGDQLVFPGTLRALAVLLEEAFPYHPNWKQSATHPAFWELYPTIDHVVPVARGGADDESNVVTTSMLRNSAKANWLIDELRWPEDRAPIVAGWDGLLGWFLSECRTRDAPMLRSLVQTAGGPWPITTVAERLKLTTSALRESRRLGLARADDDGVDKRYGYQTQQFGGSKIVVTK